MISVRLKGGMGNQMFQYAFGLGIAKKLNTQMQLDLSSLLDRSKGDFVYRDYDLDIFKVEPKFVINPNLLRSIYKLKSRKITKLVQRNLNKRKSYIKEAHFEVDQSIIDHPSDNTIYEGWWQSPKYFSGIENIIRKDFTFAENILPESLPLFEKIQSSNSICLNVRRTDFLKVDALNTTNLDYFLKATKQMADRVNRPSFFVFSDDMDWCRKNIIIDHPTHFVGHEFKGRKFGNYLQLMKACKHFIVPNSSFAWWAVWLNDHSDKIVIAPKNWFNNPDFNTTDLVPQDWIRL